MPGFLPQYASLRSPLSQWDQSPGMLDRIKHTILYNALVQPFKGVGDIYAGRAPLYQLDEYGNPTTSDQVYDTASGLTGLAMTGGVGGAPVTGAEAVFGAGPVRRVPGMKNVVDFNETRLARGLEPHDERSTMRRYLDDRKDPTQTLEQFIQERGLPDKISQEELDATFGSRDEPFDPNDNGPTAEYYTSRGDPAVYGFLSTYGKASSDGSFLVPNKILDSLRGTHYESVINDAINNGELTHTAQGNDSLFKFVSKDVPSADQASSMLDNLKGKTKDWPFDVEYDTSGYMSDAEIQKTLGLSEEDFLKITGESKRSDRAKYDMALDRQKGKDAPSADQASSMLDAPVNDFMSELNRPVDEAMAQLNAPVEAGLSAFNFNGKMFRGFTHAEALQKAVDKYGEEAVNKGINLDDPNLFGSVYRSTDDAGKHYETFLPRAVIQKNKLNTSNVPSSNEAMAGLEQGAGDSLVPLSLGKHSFVGRTYDDALGKANSALGANEVNRILDYRLNNDVGQGDVLSAVKVGDQIYMGSTHQEALDQAVAEHGADAIDQGHDAGTVKFGHTDLDGNWISDN